MKMEKNTFLTEMMKFSPSLNQQQSNGFQLIVVVFAKKRLVRELKDITVNFVHFRCVPPAREKGDSLWLQQNMLLKELVANAAKCV